MWWLSLPFWICFNVCPDVLSESLEVTYATILVAIHVDCFTHWTSTSRSELVHVPSRWPSLDTSIHTTSQKTLKCTSLVNFTRFHSLNSVSLYTLAGYVFSLAFCRFTGFTKIFRNFWFSFFCEFFLFFCKVIFLFTRKQISSSFPFQTRIDLKPTKIKDKT